MHHSAENHPIFRELSRRYAALRQPHDEVLARLEQAREQVWQRSLAGVALRSVRGMPDLPEPVAAFGGLALLIVALNSGEEEGPLFSLILVLLIAYLLRHRLARKLERSLRPIVLSRNQAAFVAIESQAEQARIRLEALNQQLRIEWEACCEAFPGYPPDWHMRRQRIKERDGFKCKECSYPDGFERRSRELHVHHIVALSDGGSNAITNLVTLCHLCHRKIDAKHAGVRKMQSMRRRRRK
jgi:5-methylcytosine-specific restriction endonuclease McrA